MKSPNLYATHNLYEGAYCLCRGMKLTGKSRMGRKVIVYFEGVDAHIEAMKYYNGDKVRAKELMDAYRTLKDFVFEGNNEER